MKIKRFRVQNYRNINDSGWVDADRILAIIGPNESGKSTTLTALYKLNPADKSKEFNINREWPRGRRQDRNEDEMPIRVEFELDDADKKALAEKFYRPQNVPNTVTISKSYRNQFHVSWSAAKEPDDEEGKNAREAQGNAILSRLPVMVYMGDYETFEGRVYLDELVQHKEENRMTKADETVEIILKLSGLDASNLSARGNDRDREERQLDLNDAALSLTESISKRWAQKSYELNFTTDGQMFITNVKEPGSNALVPLEDKSKGFQWFVSFDMRLMHDTKGTWQNAVLLLDEPGVHLHGDAQRDLLARFEEYAEGNQIIYSTHLPFMLDIEHPERFRIMVQDANGWKITNNPFEAGDSAKFPLHVAMGFSLSQTLFIGPYNLVVEGAHDVWFTEAMSGLLILRGKTGMDERMSISAPGGAPKVPFQVSLLSGHKLKVAALLDGDGEGRAARDELVKKWILEDKLVLSTDEAAGFADSTIEDLFDPVFYVQCINETYPDSKVDVGKLDNAKPILSQVQNLLGKSFNKGSVAKRLLTRIQTASDKELGDSLDRWEKLFIQIAEKTKAWYPSD
ncbi:MAG: ATP-binding protein [Fimbriimonadaceae bacterium]|nr:ATP-binding protein [Fimbriimonadaceae bacterium]